MFLDDHFAQAPRIFAGNGVSDEFGRGLDALGFENIVPGKGLQGGAFPERNRPVFVGVTEPPV